MVDATQPTNTNDDLEDLTSRVSEVERRLAIHNHADPYSQPIWVGNSSQGTANIVKPPSTGVLGENCANGDALGFGCRTAVQTQTQSSYDSKLGGYWEGGFPGGNGTTSHFLQKFVYSGVAGTLNGIGLYIKSYSNYSNIYNTFIYTLYNDNNGSVGTQIDTATMSRNGNNNLTSVTLTEITSSSKPTMVYGNTYWIRASASGGNPNYTTAEAASIYYSSTNVLNNSLVADGYPTPGTIPFPSITNVIGGDLAFAIYIDHSPSQLYRSSANSTTELLNYVGISNKDCKQGETADITTWGFKNDYSSLTVGAPYYLTNAYGTIGTSPGTNSKQIGIGFSPTTLLIGNH